MTLTVEEVTKIAYLARIQIDPGEAERYVRDLSSILEFVAQMNAVDTAAVAPMAHPLDLPQRLREDKVTEKNQRDLFQAIAPQAEAGLYLVPKVIE
ncbi:Asp-tRNA(Asn)/Glu-tRNA(Gln) amidotransferase subunit GatC [Methylothermus subterraneus]|nr:aspartyl-tRNA(Asn)/glutamyl-tRNA (Gln) amidotransferase subunit C [uncultured Gammaproteobacteria bacterium]